MSANGGHALFEARQVAKSYGGVEAISEADVAIGPGEIVALVGDNGAGKSTLIKLLAGAVQPTSGGLYVDGREVSFHGPLDARGAGIETIYQDLAVADNLTVAANLFLGREIRRSGPMGRLGFMNHREMRRQAEAVLERFDVRGVPTTAMLDQLSGGQRQIVAICRAAAWGSRLVILDEPTAALGVRESAKVLDFMRNLRSEGIAVLWVSHNMQQVVEVADRAVVMRLGRSIATVGIGDSSVEALVGLIVSGTGQQLTGA